PADHAAGVPRHDRVVRHIEVHHRAGGHDDPVAEARGRQDRGPHADPAHVADGDGGGRGAGARWVGRIAGWDGSEVVGDVRLVADEGVAADDDAGVGAELAAEEHRAVAHVHLAGRSQLERGVFVGARPRAQAHPARTAAAVVVERVRGVHVSAIAHGHVVGKLTGPPVMLQPHGVLVTSTAGFPATVAPAGTSEVTTAPAYTDAPAPIVTPFKTMALMPMRTSSPMTTGAVANGSRSPGGAAGEHSTASRRRRSGSRGWKSASAMMAL